MAAGGEGAPSAHCSRPLIPQRGHSAFPRPGWAQGLRERLPGRPRRSNRLGPARPGPGVPGAQRRSGPGSGPGPRSPREAAGPGGHAAREPRGRCRALRGRGPAARPHLLGDPRLQLPPQLRPGQAVQVVQLPQHEQRAALRVRLARAGLELQLHVRHLPARPGRAAPPRARPRLRGAGTRRCRGSAGHGPGRLRAQRWAYRAFPVPFHSALTCWVGVE